MHTVERWGRVCCLFSPPPLPLKGADMQPENQGTIPHEPSADWRRGYMEGMRDAFDRMGTTVDDNDGGKWLTTLAMFLLWMAAFYFVWRSISHPVEKEAA